jgi:hypothetical protein
MDEENQLTQGLGYQPNGMVGAMQGMQFTPSSMGQYAPIEANRSSITPRDLPEDWGGRPSGTSRRAIRMQADWDKKRAAEIEEQRALQSMDIQQKQFEMSLRDQKMQEDSFYYDRGIKEAEQKLRAQQMTEAKEFISAANSLDPQTPNYRDQLIDLRKRYPFGSLDPTVNSIIGEYDKVHSVYMEAQKETQQDTEVDQVFRIQQEATAAKYGLDTEKFVKDGVVDRVGLMRGIGEAQRNEIEEAENKASKARLDSETQALRKELSKEARSLQDEIELTEVTAERSKGTVKEEAVIKLNTLIKQRDRRVTELQNIGLPRLTKEDKDKKAFEELPEGAEFFLDGVKVRKPKKQTQAQQPAPSTPQQPQLSIAPVTPPPPAAGTVAGPTPQQVLQTSNDPLELAKASTQSAEQSSKAEQEKERQAYIARVERAFAESPAPNPDVFQTPKAKEIAASPNARELAQERYRELQSAAFTGGFRSALPKKKKEIPDDVFDKVLAEMFELRVLLGESTSDAQDLIDRIRSNK